MTRAFFAQGDLSDKHILEDFWGTLEEVLGAWRRSPLAPPVVLLASATLALELLVQIPFLGLSVLQAVFGTIAIVIAALALRARRAGW